MPRRTDGNCFPTAVRMAEGLHAAGVEGVHVCHGEVTGNGADVRGVRYEHAWVEALALLVPDDESTGWVVVDFANGQRATMRRERYYRHGEIDPEQVRRYTLDETREHLDHYGHWGPWDSRFPPKKER